MTKQEQIEEMMLDIPQTIVAYDANPKGQHLYGEQRIQIAEALYNAGYRKVPDGAVVLPREDLTKEPYNEFCKGCPNVRTRSSGITDCCADYNCRQFTRYANLIENYEQARKKTAKEILQEWADDNSSMGLDNTFVKNIAKKYGVEVKE